MYLRLRRKLHQFGAKLSAMNVMAKEVLERLVLVLRPHQFVSLVAMPNAPTTPPHKLHQFLDFPI